MALDLYELGVTFTSKGTNTITKDLETVERQAKKTDDALNDVSGKTEKAGQAF